MIFHKIDFVLMAQIKIILTDYFIKDVFSRINLKILFKVKLSICDLLLLYNKII